MATEGKPLRVRIIGNLDDPHTLDVFNADTGEKLTNVIDAQVTLSRIPDECSIMLHLFGGVQIDVTGAAEVHSVGGVTRITKP